MMIPVDIRFYSVKKDQRKIFPQMQPKDKRMMEKMTSRERVLKALNHQVTDRIPIDFGGTANTSIVKEGYDRLTKYIGLGQDKIEYLDMMMRSVRVAEEVQEYFEADFRGVFPPRTLPIKWLSSNTYIDQWGIEWTKKEDITIPAWI